MKTFFTSDTHFGHANIIKYSNRPYGNIKEHDNDLIKKWNSKITDKDTVYHLGDVFFGTPKYFNEIFHQLNFGFLYVLCGNHDKGFSEWYRDYKPKNVRFLPPYYRTKAEGTDIILCHFPIREWDKAHRGSYHLFGHVHGSHPQRQERSLDVGVDTNNYYPYSFEEIKKILEPMPLIQHH